jgi:hypothetical protein
LLDAYKNYLSVKEPRSNLGIQELITQEQFDANRIAESAKKQAQE